MSKEKENQATDKTVTLDDNALGIMAKNLGISVSDLKKKDIKVSPDFIDKLNKGEITFVKKPAEHGKTILNSDSLSKTVPLSSPRVAIEQRYKDMMDKQSLIDRTKNLPRSVKFLSRPQESNDGVIDIVPNKTSKSRFTEYNSRLRKTVLSERPAGAPSILDECISPVKLFVSQHQSPGDLLMLTRAVEDLHKSYPGKFITCMRTAAMDIWENNPYHTHIDDNDPDVQWISMGYKLVNTSNRGAHHFCHGFRKDFEAKLGVPIDQTSPHGSIFLSSSEKGWYSQVRELLGKDVPFWILDAGRKSDYTAKHWEVARFQELVDRTPDITWVQVGSMAANHYHPELTGDNLIDLRGKTSHRQFIRLMYHAAGVVTPVSYPMHLAAAVEMHPRYKRLTRPCVVIAGGREPTMWEAYSHHQYLHTCGALPCCSHGGCWKSRVIPMNDGDEKDYDDYNRTRLCERPVVSKSGQVVPKCMDMITVDDVISKVRMYMDSYDFSDEESVKWGPYPYEKPVEVQEKIQWAIDNRKDLEEIKGNSNHPKYNSVFSVKEDTPKPKRNRAPAKRARSKKKKESNK